MPWFRSLSPLPVALLLAVPLPAAGGAETDHLACMKVKDVPQTEGPVPFMTSEVISDSLADCRIKKVKLASLCVRVVKDAGDDPRGGQAAAEAYGCYKVKCADNPDGSLGIDDQFGNRSVLRGKLLTLCTPVELAPDIP
jgi:hypothetical protein